MRKRLISIAVVTFGLPACSSSPATTSDTDHGPSGLYSDSVDAEFDLLNDTLDDNPALVEQICSETAENAALGIDELEAFGALVDIGAFDSFRAKGVTEMLDWDIYVTVQSRCS